MVSVDELGFVFDGTQVVFKWGGFNTRTPRRAGALSTLMPSWWGHKDPWVEPVRRQVCEGLGVASVGQKS